MKTGTRINSLLAALFAIFFITACGPKKNVSPELLEGPGWTSVDNNLHQIDGPSPGQPERAFRVYRSGSPSKETFAKWGRCRFENRSRLASAPSAACFASSGMIMKSLRLI